MEDLKDFDKLPDRIQIHGLFFVTPRAQREVHPFDIVRAFRRHRKGDWGDVNAEVEMANEQADRKTGRFVSAYLDRNGTRFLIVTDAVKSQILMPEEQ